MINVKLKKIIAVAILIVMFFPYSACFAISQTEAGEYIAKFAYNFCMNYGGNSSNNQTVYNLDNVARKSGYLLKRHSGTPKRYENGKSVANKDYAYVNKYPMDCTSFVDMVIHQSLGIGEADNHTHFVETSQEAMKTWFEKKDSPQPGDIGLTNTNYNHVWIYLGDLGGSTGKIAEAYSDEFVGAKVTNSSYKDIKYYRIKPEVVEKIKKEDCVTSPNGMSVGSSGSLIGGKEESDFYYNGVPDGRYSVAGSFWDWLIESLLAILEFIINLLTYIVRMVFVGWTAILENFITWAVESVTHEKALDVNATGVPTNENITIETIVFNKVKTFDINFFDFSSDTEEIEAAE